MGSAEQGASPRQHDMRSPRQQDLRSPRHQELKRPVSPNVSDKVCYVCALLKFCPLGAGRTRAGMQLMGHKTLDSIPCGMEP